MESDGPFLVIGWHQASLRAPDGEDAGLRGVDYCREVLDAKHPQIGDRESAPLEDKKGNETKSEANTHPEAQVIRSSVPGTRVAAVCRLLLWRPGRKHQS